jgi:hypothetical protein
LDKGTARTKPGADVGFMQRLRSDGFKLPDELYTIEVSEASEVSAVSTSRSDTWSWSIPSLFIGNDVVRLSQSRMS